MNYTKLFTTLLIAGALLLSGCGGDDDSTPDTTPAPTTTTATPTTTTPVAPVTNETRVITTSGNTYSIKVTTEGFNVLGNEGKPLLLEFYGDSCPHCIAAIPTYNNLQAKYGNRMLILTINDGNQYTTLDNAGLQSFVNTQGIMYPTVSRENAGNMRSYAEQLIGTMPGVPYVIIVNKEGVISTHSLAPSEAQLEASILNVL